MTNTARWTTGLLLMVAATLPAAAESILYGVVGKGSSSTNPKTLFTLNKSNAASTLAFPLGNGADGEAIAYNPTDGKMYHWSGNVTNIMESVDLATGVTTNIVQTGDTHKEVLSATWNQATSRFLVVTNDDYRIYSVTPQGAYTFVNNPSSQFKGIAFAGGKLYTAQLDNDYFYTLDPSTLAILTSQEITAPGLTGPFSGFNGLATDPDTGIMWAILRVNGGNPQQPGTPGTRYLGTITPAGVFTSVGVLNDNFASIAFVPGSPLITLDGAFQIRYASNLTQGDSVVNITNTGANGNSLFGPGFGTPAGNICVNVYAFSPDEQMISCCSCLVTPNGIVHVTANNDLVSNTLTGIRPDSIVIKLVATATGRKYLSLPGDVGRYVPTYDDASCNNSAALAGTLFPVTGAGLLAWGTTLHSSSINDPPASGAFSITETPFLPASLDPQRFLNKRDITETNELTSLTNRCANITGNGSSFGICRSCRLGGLGGAKQ